MSYLFLIPLLLGFAFNSASAFTTNFSRRWGEKRGRLACIILRNILGIPIWVVGYALAILANSKAIFTTTILTSILAWLLILSGAGIILVGIASLHWRAAAPSLGDTLVSSGLYAYIRHPLYCGMFLELAGLFLWHPTTSVLVACLLGVLWTLLQARLEERDLLQRIPRYKDYMQRVPRFIPRFKAPLQSD